jgi:hypothetical protein
MLVKVLKPFSYAPDVRTLLSLTAGQVVEIDDSVIAGLEAEGFIGEASDAEIEAAAEGPVELPAPVIVPDDWKALSWSRMRALALDLGAGPKINKVGAVALIEAHIAAQAD